jgi:pimeloyl-ACP methyl ester carboxylesterase
MEGNMVTARTHVGGGRTRPAQMRKAGPAAKVRTAAPAAATPTTARARAAALLAAVVAVLVAATAVAGPSPASAQPATSTPPMIFVHGFMGSGQQFESQALRFTSNGYPADHIDVLEHDSLSWPGTPEHQEEVWSRLDGQVADLLATTGADQVNLLGHSQGTGFVQGYLNSSSERADRVAQYVNLDGGAGGTVPASVETLAVWGEGDPARAIPGATNIQFPDQAHTEVVNSPETFAAIYEFFTGEEPEFVHVVRAPDDEVEVSGRALLFPQNEGAGNATLSIWAVDGRTGLRLGDTPEATYDMTGDGSWGPFAADPDTFYEFALDRPDSGTHHVFMPRFVRDDRWVRILTSEPGGLADSFWELGDDHQNIAILRNKEWWGDQGDASDVLEVAGQNVMTGAISPRANRTIGIFVHDDGVDGQSDLSAPVSPTGLPFLTGVDLFIPAGDPPTGTVAVTATPRRGDGAEGFCIPNYASTSHRSSVQFNSFHHLVNPDGTPAEGHADPECEDVVDAAPPSTPGTPDEPVAPPAQPVPGTPSYTG